jgi:hypothetical protein
MPPYKIFKKNIEISLMRLHVGKHILSGQVSAFVVLTLIHKFHCV